MNCEDAEQLQNVLKATTKMKKPFNVKKFYRRTFLVIYDIISVILASYLALMIRYGFSLAEIPEHFMKPITNFLPFSIVITLIVLR